MVLELLLSVRPITGCVRDSLPGLFGFSQEITQMTGQSLQDAQIGSHPFRPESSNNHLKKVVPYGEILFASFVMPYRV